MHNTANAELSKKMKEWMQTCAWDFVDFTELADLICSGLEAHSLQMVTFLCKPSE